MTIYLDHHATTPLDPRVLDAMLPYFREKFGNPASSSHAFGHEAAAAVEHAREQISGMIGGTIVFTSGATEANNLAIFGSAPASGGHFITSPIEHPSILESARALGCAVTLLPVDSNGRVNPSAVEAAIRPDTFLISVMSANNEVGTIQPIAEIAAIARKNGVRFHTDASQALGKTAVAAADLTSFTGHKFHGPVGCGALVLGPDVQVRAILHGGGQEGGLRAGTLNTPGIVGLGVACALLTAENNAECAKIAALRDQLQAALTAEIPGLRVSGANRLPGNLHICLPGVTSGAMVAAMPGLAVSAGAACHSGDPTGISPVLGAIGLTAEEAKGALRFGLGRFTTAEEIGEAAKIVTDAWKSFKS